MLYITGLLLFKYMLRNTSRQIQINIENVLSSIQTMPKPVYNSHNLDAFEVIHPT